MDIDIETLKQEWSQAVLRWWFLPILASALAAATTYPIALQFDPPRAFARTYIYMPHHNVSEFTSAVNSLQPDIKQNQDAHGNQFLEFTAPSVEEAKARLVSVRAALEDIAIASLAETESPMSAKAQEWVRKLQTEMVTVAPIGGGGEATSLAISWAFMLTIGGIVFMRSRAYDATTSSSAA